MITGCSEHKGDHRYQILDAAKYRNWEFYTFENIKIFHQPNHLQQDKFPEVAQMYLRSIKKITEVLQMTPYNDTLVIVYYTGFGQGREMTGREYPFAENGIIHFWLPSFLGPTLMQYMLSRWTPVEPRHRFLKHGLIALFDFSGQNYHNSTHIYIERGKFISLEKLAIDTNINSDTERFQSAEAASFVAYVLANHGVSMLKEMYQSQLPFDEMVRDFFFMPVDSLEKRWLDYVSLYITPDTTGQQ
ncbi:MAG: hypothetical protein JXA92_01500 [candidate division Zixibacteria bacterium]|nr:hypothetical protein [candidate division Zixibacteria bacterium]